MSKKKHNSLTEENARAETVGITQMDELWRRVTSQKIDHRKTEMPFRGGKDIQLN